MVAMNTAEINRQINNLCRIGTITELDYGERQVRIKTGENITAWLSWPASIGNNFVHWRPLRLNTQVVMLCPSADLSQGVIVGMIYSTEITPAETSELVDVVEFGDGTTIGYNSESSILTVDCAGSVVVNCTTASVTASENAVIDAGGDITATAGGNVAVEATGDAAVTGATVTLNGGAAGGVVCQTHTCAFTNGPHPVASPTVTSG